MNNCKDRGSFGLRLFGSDICILLYQSNQKKQSGSINGQEQFDLNVGTVVNCLLTKLLDYFCWQTFEIELGHSLDFTF